jgi:hypothetical protein
MILKILKAGLILDSRDVCNPLYPYVLQEEDLKWVEENIPTSLTDKYVWRGGVSKILQHH